MGVLIANTGLTLATGSPTHVLNQSLCTITTASTSVNADGNPIYASPLKVAIPPGACTCAEFTSSGTNTVAGTCTISASKISKTKHGGNALIGTGDQGSVTLTGLMTQGTSSTTTTANVTIKVDIGGSTTVKAS